MKRVVYHVEVVVRPDESIGTFEFDTAAIARGWVRYDRSEGRAAAYVRVSKPIQPVKSARKGKGARRAK